MQITIEGVLKNIEKSILNSFTTLTYGLVISTNELDNGFLTIQPLHCKNNNSMSITKEAPIYFVPVVCLSTITSSITPSINVGDTVLLGCMSHNIDSFKQGNKTPHVVTTNDKFNLDNAVAILGLSTTLENPFSSLRYNKGHDKSALQLTNNIGKPTENNIKLNSDGSVDLTSDQGINLNTQMTTAKEITVDDIIIRGVGSVKLFMQTHIHGYTDDGNPMQTTTPVM